jgi:hypothetical protein
MKKITATDIVPLSVLYNIAKRVRTAAAAIAKSKNVPRTDARTIGIPVGKVTQNQAKVNLTLNEVSAAYEWGSGIHRKSSVRGGPAKYKISPKKPGGALAFYENAAGTWDYGGGMPQMRVSDLKGAPEGDDRGLFFSVMHPGVKARPFLQPAKEQTRQANLKELRENSTKNIRLIIVGMSRKV